MYLVTASEIQEMDRKTIDSFGIPGRVLMENAGRGATSVFLKTFEGLSGRRVGVLAGRGNNGGDGFVIARYLAQKGIGVRVFLLGLREKVSGDAAANLDLLSPLNVPVHEVPDHASFSALSETLEEPDIWVDAILGTGLKSEVKGFFRTVIDFANRSAKPVFAVDIPSGLDCDTGHPWGIAIRAAATATFGFPKIGHLVYPGAEYTGKLHVVDIGIPPHIAREIGPRHHLLTPGKAREGLKPRIAHAHKGNAGHLLVVAGSTGKTGAAALTAGSALRAGSGLVTLAVAGSLNPTLEAMMVEAMTYPLPESGSGFLGENCLDAILALLEGKSCLAMGPGLGAEPGTGMLVRRILKEAKVPMVIDADGLNHLAGHTHLLKEAGAPVVLTPHPGEMARLVNADPRTVQKDRIGYARRFAQAFGVHLVLKGARSVIAHPDGSVFINPTGNPGMASGGMGDVLTGILAGLITQGYSPVTATHAGVFVHGAAADNLAVQRGPVGYLATEVMNIVPAVIGKLLDFREKPDTGEWISQIANSRFLPEAPKRPETSASTWERLLKAP